MDAQPNPDAMRREARQIADLLGLLWIAYSAEHEEGWPPGGAGLGIQNGQSDATLAALESPEQRESRQRCRRVAHTVRKVNKMLRGAIVELTLGEEQPRRPSPDAVIDRTEFDQALHEQRERELRR